jgi:radical SAM protein with 4Fe4S-binding SPASM domain
MESNIKNREENLVINLKEYEDRKVILKSLPTVLFVELTQNCNSHCIMCGHASLYPKGYQSRLDMEDNVFNFIKEKLFPFANMVDLRGYGESSILRNFDKRIKETVETGVKLRLVTNALAIKQPIWELLMKESATVVVSVDSANPNTMKKLGRGSFNQLKKSLEIAVNEREKSNNKGKILFNTVVSSFNLEELDNIILLAKEYEIKRVTMIPVQIANESPLSLVKRKDDINRYILSAQEIAREVGVELRLGVSLDDSQIIKEKLPDRCIHPWSFCNIDYAGNVGYCDHLMGYDINSGNLKNNSFDEIWNGMQIQKARMQHIAIEKFRTIGLKNKLPLCNWCYRRRYIDFEEDINKNFQSKIVSTTFCESIIPNNNGEK